MKESNSNPISLENVHASVDTGEKKGFWGKLMAFIGPAYLVSVGYMDPGNWATDLAGGSQFGYKLIWVLLMSNLIALLLQSLCTRLGIVRRKDLAQASREMFPTSINYFLYFLAEIAIAATDLAEVIGMAIGLQLLFGVPLLVGVSLTILDTFLFMLLQRLGIRKMEAFILALILIIALSFFLELFMAKPEPLEVAKGFIPSLPDAQALYIAIGIIGATVMPHNLYLHSALVQTRKVDQNPKSIKEALKFNFVDSTVALNMAFLVNAAILILAAATFYRSGNYDIAEIQDAHMMLERILGTKWAPILFAVALIAAGQSSTITGTLAGQIVMEGYLNLRIQPWLRRLLTRLVAIAPAFITIWLFGERETGDLLVFSQVILSLQLGFAIIPLIHFVSDKERMKGFAIKPWVKVLAWLSTGVIVLLNIQLVYSEISGWLSRAQDNQWLIWITVIPMILLSVGVLLYITFFPWFAAVRERNHIPHGNPQGIKDLSKPEYQRIAIALDFSKVDSEAIRNALAQGNSETQYLLIHVVETAGAWVMGKEISDHETEADQKMLNEYKTMLEEMYYSVDVALGFGNPKKAIPQLCKQFKPDLLVMGSHGHKGIKDIIFGTTIEQVRHQVNAPVLIVNDIET